MQPGHVPAEEMHLTRCPEGIFMTAQDQEVQDV